VAYLQLAHNQRHLKAGSPVAKVIHKPRSGGHRGPGGDTHPTRVLDLPVPHPRTGSGRGAEIDVEVLDSRRIRGSWTVDRLWERLGVGMAIGRVAKLRCLDGEAVERVIFALVVQRALEQGSKLATTRWVTGGSPSRAAAF
jgi:hypothetical protein